MTYTTDVGTTLAGAGFRPTRQRRAVFETLVAMKTHPTAEEVFDVVRRGLPHISLATVYKALESLVAVGLALKLGCAESSARYDGRVDAHYHARCRRCGLVADVEADGELLSALRTLRQPLARLDRVRLEFLGLCENCHTRALRSATRPAETH
jgi:Fe2+ or Zn2+ uptake regulation protein